MEMIELASISVEEYLEALRSGKYKQGKGGLHPTSKTFCCLGVACDLLNPEWSHGAWANTPAKISYSNIVPPPSVEFPAPIRKIFAKLMKMNDSGSSFSMIAKMIDTRAKPGDRIRWIVAKE